MSKNLNKRNRLIKRINIVGIVLLGLIAAILAWLTFVFFPIKLLDAPPNYPNQTNFNYALPLLDSLIYYKCTDTHEGFGGINYNVFATNDTKQQVLDFYQQKLTSGNNSELTETIGIGPKVPNDNKPQDFRCYIGKRIRQGQPTNVIVFLNPANVRDAKIITKVFPNAPANSLVILLLQGYIYYD